MKKGEDVNMSKKSGAGINLFFFGTTIILVGALAGIGLYTCFHEEDHETSAEEPVTFAYETIATAETTTSTTTTATTSTSTTQTTTTVTTESRLKYQKFNETVAADQSNAVITLADEEYGDLFHSYHDSEWTFSDFSDKAVVGVKKDKASPSESYYINCENAMAEKLDIGFTAEITGGKKLKVESYGGELSELRIVSNNDKYADTVYTSDVGKGTLEADLTDSSYLNGLYVVNGRYTVNGKSCDLNVYLFVNCKSDDSDDYSFYLCSANKESTEPATEEDTASTTDRKDD